ncbi:MAG: EAL domain-containing protein [Gammaproteobacteria bacterium]|nr:EAL domain-containing protein [Gammaproteobacteria bacterium]
MLLDKLRALTPQVPANQSLERAPVMDYAGRDDHQTLLANATIMMVDDEPITMEVVQTFLEDTGYEHFLLIEDSRLALDKILEHRPDILLLDLVMPHVSGFEILTRIRQHPKISYLPVIILTSSSEAETKLQALDKGATDFLAKPVDPSELALRVRNTLAAKAYQDQLAYYDPLTNLPNRRYFLDRLEWSIHQANRQNSQLAVLHIALNQFRRIYDALGPTASDQVIRQVAERIRECIRHTDTVGRTHTKEGYDNVLYRMGGNEFSVLCTQLCQPEDAAKVARRVLEVMRLPFDAGGTEVQMPTTIGIAGYPGDAQTLDTIVQRAGIAAAQAAEKGETTFEFYSDQMNLTSLQRLQMEADLRHAIQNDELVLHYQPKVDIKTNQVTGVETLVRWQRTTGELVYPNNFIPLAEECGLIHAIGVWVLQTACRQLAQWQSQGKWIHVAVNLSAKQLYGGGLVETVAQIIDASGVDPSYLTLELTESLFMEDADYTVQTLTRLMALHTRISMDDFGTGYSSLSYLKAFPLHELKIDRSFLNGVNANRHDQALVSAIVYLAHEFGLTVTAEGVEEASQLEFLATIGCDQYQGYLFSKPLPVAQITPMLSSCGIVNNV